MSLVHGIQQRTKFSTESSVATAMMDMRSASDLEIMRYIVMGETLNQTSGSTRNAVALCRAERDRRDALQVEKLTLRSTRWAALIGAFATILGATLGAFLTYAVSTPLVELNSTSSEYTINDDKVAN